MKNLYVEDSFYKAPSKIVELGQKAQYLQREVLSEEYPGTESIHGFWNQSMKEKIEGILGTKIKVEPSKYSFGTFKRAGQEDRNNNHIHIDQSEWTAIIYLNRFVSKEAGTHLYQHIPSGNFMINRNSISQEDFQSMINDSRNPQLWRVKETIENKFNRIAIFPSGSIFHSAQNYFGSDEINSRLIQVFFFDLEK